MRIVFDSNVIIAAFASRGLCNSLFEMSVEKYTIVISEHIINEVRTAFSKKLKMQDKIIVEIIDYLHEFCELQSYTPLRKSISRDKDDDEILALASSQKVDYIITGDKDLLVLETLDTSKIITPRDFWNIAKLYNGI